MAGVGARALVRKAQFNGKQEAFKEAHLRCPRNGQAVESL
jgi:hypothetical protein